MNKGLWNIMGYRKVAYLISAAFLLPGMIALATSGLKLGIDFTGGSLIEVQFEQPVEQAEISQVLTDAGFADSQVQITQAPGAVIRTRALTIETADDVSLPDAVEETLSEDSVEATETSTTDEIANAETAEQTAEAAPTIESGDGLINEKADLMAALTAAFGTVQEQRFETIGPVISEELTRKALYSVVIASLAIILYIAWAFRSVPKPASSYRFGVSAIIALIHDVLFTIGAFAILGMIWDIEVSAMFVVAVLTVMGFSVHDSIVVFDRIREKLRQEPKKAFEAVVNGSILETLARSLNTSFTVVITLLALYLFGGASIANFTLALLIGVVVGSYSSIFIASSLLVDWQNWVEKRAAAEQRRK